MTFYRKDYTARDRDSLYELMVTYLQNNYSDLDLDLEEGSMSLEAILLDIATFLADNLHLYIDAALSEAFIDSAAERQSLISMAKFDSYNISGKSAATVELSYTYTKDNPMAPDSVMIHRGETINCKSGWSFTIVSSQLASIIEAGSETITAYQGRFVTDEFTPTAQPNQRFTSSRTDVATNVDPVIEVGGLPAMEVESLVGLGAGLYYELHWNGDGSFWIKFGDGVDGDIPGADITMEYLATDGANGNVDVGKVEGSLNPDPDITVEYTNELPATGGSEAEEIDELRINIPAHTASQDRQVSNTDYLSLIESYPGIRYAGFEFDDFIRRVVCYVLSSSYGAVTDSQLAVLDRDLRTKKQLGSRIVFRNVDFVGALIKMAVTLDSSMKYSIDSLKSNVGDTIDSFFQPGDDDPIYNRVGKDVSLSKFYDVISSIDGINDVNVTMFTREPRLKEVSWSENDDSIYLDGWYLRPSVKLDRSGMGNLLGSGVGSLATETFYSNQRVKRKYVDTSSMVSDGSNVVRTSGLRHMISDTLIRPTSVSVEKVKVSLSAVGGDYVWSSWLDDDGNLVEPFTSRDVLTPSQTAHFMVTHLLDDKVFAESCIGYLGTTYALDSGSFFFRLNANEVEHEPTGTLYIWEEGDYIYARTTYKHLVAGSLEGQLEYAIGLCFNELLIDDGNGGLFVQKEQVGYVDYDQGLLVFPKSELCDVDSLSIRLTSYSYFDFSNNAGEHAEILLSPYLGSIIVDTNEFCVLSDLDLEVTYE